VTITYFGESFVYFAVLSVVSACGVSNRLSSPWWVSAQIIMSFEKFEARFKMRLAQGRIKALPTIRCRSGGRLALASRLP
jgi:hypothetical protein